MEKRICKKCLSSLREEEIYYDLKSYVDNLEESVRADDGLYNKRLLYCKKCSHLQNGICRLCGCFVEMRAAIAVQRCPATEHYW